MGNIIVIIIVLLIVGGASYKIYKDKKKNVKCWGCPYCQPHGKCSDCQQKIK